MMGVESPRRPGRQLSLSLSFVSSPSFSLLFLLWSVLLCSQVSFYTYMYIYTHNIEMFLYLSCVLVHVYLTNRVVYALFVEWVLVYLSNSSGHPGVLV